VKEQIKQALENANKLPWRLDSFGAVVNCNNELVQWFEDGHVTAEKEDAHLIANAPEWLRWQNERIEQLEKALKEVRELILITQELRESPSLHHNASTMAIYKINQALGKEE